MTISDKKYELRNNTDFLIPITNDVTNITAVGAYQLLEPTQFSFPVIIQNVMFFVNGNPAIVDDELGIEIRVGGNRYPNEITLKPVDAGNYFFLRPIGQAGTQRFTEYKMDLLIDANTSFEYRFINNSIAAPYIALQIRGYFQGKQIKWIKD